MLLVSLLWLCWNAVVAKDHEITIVSYNDVYIMEQTLSRGIGRGGAARVAAVLEEYRAKDPNTLVLFAGDTLSPSLWSLTFDGLQMIRMHNQLKVDFACLGNHEMDLGLSKLKVAIEQSEFVWLNANCFERETKQLVGGTRPYAVKHINGLKVGFFGVMYDMKDPFLEVYFTSPLEAAREQIAILKSEHNVDMIIALTHQTWEEDNEFASEVHGVDLIYGGHDHRAMLQTDFGTPYLKASADFKNIWITKLSFVNTTTSGSPENTHALDTEYHNIAITHDLTEEPEMKRIVSEYTAVAEQSFRKVIGSTCTNLDVSQQYCRTRETKVGNFMADAHRFAYHTESEAGVMNGGGLRSDKNYPAGNLSYSDIVTIVPFGNVIYQVRINGETLLQFIAATNQQSCGAGNAVRPNGYLALPSGFTYKYHCHSARHGKVIELLWANTRRPIQPNEWFLFALTDHWYQTYIDIFRQGQSTVVVGDRDAITIDIAARKRLVELGQICPSIEGRFEITFDKYSTQ